MERHGQGRRVLVTGGTGMIGTALVKRLLADACRTTLLVRPDSPLDRLQEVAGDVDVVRGDVRDAQAVEGAVRAADPDVVYHLASTALNQAELGAHAHLATIVTGTLNVLEAVSARRGLRLVATGSVAEYGSGRGLREVDPLRPSTVVGAAKASATLLLQAYARLHGLETVVLRLCLPYGPGEHPRRLIPHVILSALAGQDVPLTSGIQQRDPVYLDDVIEALVLAATRPVVPGLVLNIGSGEGVPVKQIVERILELMGCPVKAVFGAISTRPDEIMEMSVDRTMAREQLGWEPRTPLAEGLRATIAWFSRHREWAYQQLNEWPTAVEEGVPALLKRAAPAG